MNSASGSSPGSFGGDLILSSVHLQSGESEPVDVIVRKGRIDAITTPGQAKPEMPVLDTEGCFLVPGLIDLQVNGGHGIDLLEQPERVLELANALPQYGVTSWLPTITTCSSEKRRHIVSSIAAALSSEPETGAAILGLHLEGPALNRERKGAHPVEHLTTADQILDELLEVKDLALVTLAPEVSGAITATRSLFETGVVVSVGHTEATAAQSQTAFDAGARYVTHLFNAMTPLHHRRSGPIPTALLDRRITAGLIADGVHVSNDVLALAWQSLGPERCNLVSDATAAMGMPAGSKVSFGGQTLFVGDAMVTTEDGTLAGSVASLDTCLRNFIAAVGCSVDDAIATVTCVPAQLLGLTDRGNITLGARADLVLFDSDLSVAATVINGNLAHRSPNARGEPPIWRS